MRERLGHVLPALAVSGGVLVVAVIVGWLTRGGAAAIGAGVGVALVVASYLISSAAVAWADSISPQLVLSVGLATYSTKIVLLGVVMVVIVGTGWAGTTAIGLGIIAGVVGWTTAQIWWTLRRGSGHPAGVQE